MYCKLDTAVIEITRSFESEYNNSPQFEIYTENRYMGTLSLAIASISKLIAIGDGTDTRSTGFVVVVDQFMPGYQFRPTLNFLEHL